MAQIKITADTTETKKSILELSKTMNSIKGSKISIFTTDDRKFLKGELKKEITAIKARIKDNNVELKKMVETQKTLTKDSLEYIENMRKITEAYKTQAKLSKEMGTMKSAGKDGGGGGNGIMGALTGKGSGMMGMLGGLLGGALLGAGAMAIMKGVQATNQYTGGVSNRVKLKGLGVDEDNFGSAKELGRVGLTEQDMIERRRDATATLGRDGTSQAAEMKKAAFERSFGLEGGTMTGIASQLRGQTGGKGASDVQMKLQASVFAAGIEDAIGPYLKSATELLSSINENGTSNTTEMISLMSQLTKDGERTPEQISKGFQTINSAVQGASGESSAFLQTAFARQGIGGGTIGGTKFSMASGGMMGLNRDELEKRGYNKDLLNNMEGSGMMSGVGKRTDAIMGMFKEAGGLKSGQGIGDVKDTNRMVGMNNMANSVFGTKGNQGFDALMMLEKVQKKQMSQKDFNEKLKNLQEGQDPAAQRLDKINDTLAGQTDILTQINTNLMESLGKQGVTVRNAGVKLENQGIVGATNIAGAVNDTGLVQKGGDLAAGGMEGALSGGYGGKMWDSLHAIPEREKLNKMMSPEAIEEKRNSMKKQWYPGKSDEEIEQIRAQRKQSQGFPSAKEIGTEVANALKSNPIQNNVSVKTMMPSGHITEKTKR